MTRQQFHDLNTIDFPAIARHFKPYGVVLNVTSKGHRWQFSKWLNGEVVAFAEWWPTTRRLVLNRDYDNPKHPADVRIAETILDRFFKIPALIPPKPDGWARTAGRID